MTDLPPWAQQLIECERRVLGPSKAQRERALIALTALVASSDVEPREHRTSSGDERDPRSTASACRASRPD